MERERETIDRGASAGYSTWFSTDETNAMPLAACAWTEVEIMMVRGWPMMLSGWPSSPLGHHQSASQPLDAHPPVLWP